MLLVDDVVEGILGGTSWGVGVLAVGAVALVAGPRAKPLAKQAIKGYMVGTQRVREWSAEATERLQDLYAEAKYEYESELSQASLSDVEGEAQERTDGGAEGGSEKSRRRGAQARAAAQPA